MARKTTTKNLVLSEAEKASLRSLAKEWGFIIGRGPMAEEGSIDQLINKLAHGGALFVPMAVDEEYLPVVVDQLKQLAKSENLSILARLATALERADKLYHGEPIDPDPRTITCPACGEQNNIYPPDFQPSPGQGDRWYCGECGAFIEPQTWQSYGGGVEGFATATEKHR